MKLCALLVLILCLAMLSEPPLNSQQANNSAVEGYIGVFTRGNPRTRSNGIEVSAVERGGPADEAGIRPGDVIISMGGAFPVSIDELRDLVHSFQPGNRVDVSYRRGALITETYVIIGSESVAQTSKKQMQGPTAVKAHPIQQAESTTAKPPLRQRTTAVTPQTGVRTSNTVNKPAGTTTTVVAQAKTQREVSEPAEHTNAGQSVPASATPELKHTESSSAAIVSTQDTHSKPRVFVKGQGTVNATTHSGGAISGGDSWVFGHRSDTTVDAHDESIELSKDIRELCPGVIVTLKEDSADFFVMLNRESKAKKGLLSKNSQVLVANKNGDVIWTKDVRQVRSAAKDVCSAILSPPK